MLQFLAAFKILPFDDDDAEQFGIIRSDLKKRGTIIGPYDMLIAAQALSKNIILVTNNIKEFCRIENLRIEDWKD